MSYISPYTTYVPTVARPVTYTSGYHPYGSYVAPAYAPTYGSYVAPTYATTYAPTYATPTYTTPLYSSYVAP
jgi:hypothetical protein